MKLRFLCIALGGMACGSVSEDTFDAPVDVDPCSDVDGAGCEYAITEHPVAVLEGHSTVDPALGRTNPILIRYPSDMAGPRPVVLWSHGGEFNNNGHRLGDDWGETIAAAGWVVVHVAHTVPTIDQVRAMCMRAQVPMTECTPQSFIPPMVARPRDVVALLDGLPAISTFLRDRTGVELDLAHVVVGGWSSGSQAPLVLGGALRTIAPSVTRFAMADTRPIGMIALSPQGPDFSGFFEIGPGDNSWSAIARPVLVLTGDNDLKDANPDLLGGIRRRAWDNLPGGNGDQHLLYSTLPEGVGGHDTFNLGDAASLDARLERLSRALGSTVRAYLDARIGIAAATDYLASDLPARLAGSATEWSTK